MALRSNVRELPGIARFCRKRTKDYFRFDPFLHLRLDGNRTRNEEIRSERFSPEDIVALERSDPERFKTLEKRCDTLIVPELSNTNCNHLFHCSAGNDSFTLGHNGIFRLCSALCSPDCVYDLKKGSLTHAWNIFVHRVRGMRSNKKMFLETCRICPLMNLCQMCPAHAHLETGNMDAHVKYFCSVAHARAKQLRKGS